MKKRVIATFMTSMIIFSSFPVLGAEYGGVPDVQEISGEDYTQEKFEEKMDREKVGYTASRIAAVEEGTTIINSGTCGEELEWKLYDNGTLQITGSGGIEDYFYSESPWFSDVNEIKVIVLGEGITSIGNYAFADCRSLENIEIPSCVMSIGEWAFSGCSSLKSIEIPSGVTSIGECAFSNCSSLINIEVDEMNRVYASYEGSLYDKEFTIFMCAPGGIEEVNILTSVLTTCNLW